MLRIKDVYLDLEILIQKKKTSSNQIKSYLRILNVLNEKKIMTWQWQHTDVLEILAKIQGTLLKKNS